MKKQNAIITKFLIAACVIIFLIQQNFYEEYVNIPIKVLNGEYYRLFTAGFLHANLAHIGANMVMLLSVGKIVESEGKIKYIITYIVSLLVGSITSLAYNIWIGRPEIISLGASGAIFGLIGSAFAYYKMNIDNPKYKQMGQWIIKVIALNIAATFTTPNIDFMAHLGGFIGGFTITCLLNISGGKKILKKELLALSMFGAAMVGTVACKPENTQETNTEQIDPNLSEAGPVDQEKKKDLNEEDEIGKIKYNISSAWQKTTMNAVKVYVLNDEQSSHIQVTHTAIDGGIDDKDVKAVAEGFFNKFYGGNNGTEITEKDVNGIKAYGKKGMITVQEKPFEVKTYLIINGEDMYRFALLGHVSIKADDEQIFDSVIDSVKNK